MYIKNEVNCLYYQITKYLLVFFEGKISFTYNNLFNFCKKKKKIFNSNEKLAAR